MPFLLSFSGGSHVTDNDDEFCAITVTFSGGPSGAKSQMRWDGYDNLWFQLKMYMYEGTTHDYSAERQTNCGHITPIVVPI
jgi:hypothetical protein